MEPSEAEKASRMARRIQFMSKGLMTAAAGAWICAAAGARWVIAEWPAAKPFAAAFLLAAGGALACLNVGIERLRARKNCYVRTFRPSTPRENVLLVLVILAGVAAVIALNEVLPAALDRDWIGAAWLAAITIATAAYFLVHSRRCGLVELGLLGAGMIAGGVLVLASLPLSEANIDVLLFRLEAGFGALLLALGVSLHRRWTAWRARILAEEVA